MWVRGVTGGLSADPAGLREPGAQNLLEGSYSSSRPPQV